MPKWAHMHARADTVLHLLHVLQTAEILYWCIYSHFPLLLFMPRHCPPNLTSSSAELSLMSPSPLAPTHSCYQQLLIRVTKIQEVPQGSPAWKRNVHLSLSHTHVYSMPHKETHCMIRWLWVSSGVLYRLHCRCLKIRPISSGNGDNIHTGMFTPQWGSSGKTGAMLQVIDTFKKH